MRQIQQIDVRDIQDARFLAGMEEEEDSEAIMIDTRVLLNMGNFNDVIQEWLCARGKMAVTGDEAVRAGFAKHCIELWGDEVELVIASYTEDITIRTNDGAFSLRTYYKGGVYELWIDGTE